MQGRDPTCQPRPPTSSRFARVRTRAIVRSLWGGGAARTLAARARRAALVVVGPCPMKGHYTSKRPFSFGAKPCCSVRATVSRTARLRVCAHAIAPLRSLSLGRKRSTRACGPRTSRYAGRSRLVPYGRALHQREASLFRCKTVVQRAGRGLPHSPYLAHIRKPTARETKAGAWHHGLAPNERALTLARRPSRVGGKIQTRAARQARLLRLLHTQSACGGRSLAHMRKPAARRRPHWHVGARPCTERERPLAGAASFHRT